MDDESKSQELNLKEYWAMVVRRRWALLGPLLAFGWMGFAVAHWWPYLYRSAALVLVVEQRVPEQYVTPNVVSDLQGRLESMTQQVLSRTRLQGLIEKFDLYHTNRARAVMEDVIEQMRKDIRIVPVTAPGGKAGQLTAFRISYAAPNAPVAQQVTSELTSFFIEENLQARTQASEGTTTFLENQLEDARKDLAEQEQRASQFKTRYLGELPEQEQSNLQIMSALEAQLHASNDALARTSQEKIYLESMRNEYLAMLQGGAGKPTTVTQTPLESAEAQLKALRQQLADLNAIYSPQHPDIIQLKDRIKQWESTKKQLEAEEAKTARDAAQQEASTEETARLEAKKEGEGGYEGRPYDATARSAARKAPALAEIESRLKSIGVQLQGREKEMAALQARIKEVQAHLALTPLRQQQLAEVTRAYENSRTYYQSLLQKKLQSELATNLEKRQQGEQFRILDPASLPEKPDEPNPLEIVLIGWGVGVCAGIALMAFIEFKDETLHSERDIASLPVIVRIPVLHTPREESRLRWYRGLEVAGITLFVILSVGASVYTYFRT